MRTWCEVRNFTCEKFRLTPDYGFSQVPRSGYGFSNFIFWYLTPTQS